MTANHDQLISRLSELRLVPVVVADRVADAATLATALVDGGLPIAEVTFRTDAAADVIRELSTDGRMLVGAGTVITAQQVDVAADAGAEFIVSPGLSRAVVERAKEHGILVIPGISTATEVIAAIDLGLEIVKFFPAETSGGAPGLRALASVFRQLRFIPTGGIDAERARDYLAIEAVLAVGGSWMVPRALVADGDVSALTELVEASVIASR